MLPSMMSHGPQVFFVESCHGFVSDDTAFELVCYSFDWNGWEFSMQSAIPDGN